MADIKDMELFMGIDPGKSGCIVLLDEDGNMIASQRLSDTMHDVSNFLAVFKDSIRFAVLEKVSAMHRQGVASTFKFGTSYGFCLGLLAAFGIPYELHTPSKWQGVMRCRSKGDKKVTKAAAQALFPKVKITHAEADAALIAEFCRRTRLGI